MLPPKKPLPLTAKVAEGVEVPIPTRPLLRIVNADWEVVANVVGEAVSKYRLPPAFRNTQWLSVMPAVRASCGAVEEARVSWYV